MMLIITQNSQITGVEKELLNTLNIDLTSISDFINTINLQLSSLQNTPLNINNQNFSVKEIEILSTDNIKIFDLNITESTTFEQTTAFENHQFETSKTLEGAETLIKSTPEEKKVSFEDPVINLINEENSEDFLTIPKEKQKEENNTLNINIINEPKPEKKPVKEEVKTEEKLINFEEEKIEFEIHQKEETEISKIQLPQDGIIEISFEDDLEEIRNILNMNKDEFNKALTSELKKASEELGIDYNELVNWHDQLIEQIKDEKSHIYKYINKKDYTNLHESYHKLKGAALNLRLSKIALVLKKLDELSKSKEDIEKIKKITDDFYNLIENEAITLSEQSSEEQNEQQTDTYIENIILKTIQSYLSTQNEAQFQKDKKYIEKLLNTKINSIKDLQKIIKGLQ